MKGFWTALLGIPISCGIASAGTIKPCETPSPPFTTSAGLSEPRQIDGCVPSEFDSNIRDVSLRLPKTGVTSPAIDRQAQGLPSPASPIDLRTPPAKEFPGPADGLVSHSSTPSALNLQQPAPTNRTTSGQKRITIALLGIGIFGLTVPLFIYKKRDQIHKEAEELQPAAAYSQSGETGSEDNPVPVTAEEVLQTSTRRCRYCTSPLVRPSQHRSGFERHVLSRLSVTPQRCLSCRRRYYALALMH